MKAAFVLLILATAFAFYLVWMNRASEKITATAIPIAVASLVGIFLAVLVFGGEPPITAEFPSSFLYRTKDKMPWDPLLLKSRHSTQRNPPFLLQSRRFTQSLFAPAELHKAHPEFFNDASNANGTMLYHHLLQKSIIDWMGMRYRASWQAEIAHFDLPWGREERFGPAEDATEPSNVLSTDEIVKLLQGNKFADINTGIPPQIALPPNTKIRIKAPQSDVETGEILLENQFCRLSIQTQYSSWMRGVGGYNLLAGMSDDENNQLATATYLVRIKVQFSRLRSGHPKMPKYKAWAGQLVDGLRRQFDEQLVWAKTKEDYLFWKQIPQFDATK